MLQTLLTRIHGPASQGLSAILLLDYPENSQSKESLRASTLPLMDHHFKLEKKKMRKVWRCKIVAVVQCP